jgi:hypothetical protein
MQSTLLEQRVRALLDISRGVSGIGKSAAAVKKMCALCFLTLLCREKGVRAGSRERKKGSAKVS